MRRLLPVIAFWICTTMSYTQNYLGAGVDAGITVTASSTFSDTIWALPASPANTVNGAGMLADYFEAHRFLQQATIGFDSTHVQDVLSLGMEGWIDYQYGLPVESLGPKVQTIVQIIVDSIIAGGGTVEWGRPDWTHFNYGWWQVNTMNEDLLRHKVACALSEILVVSRNSELSGYGEGLADYYDMLLANAFGNYRDLLYDVTLHACMAHYLSHANNPKTDTAIGQHPDENYAREVKQLMTIGLYELNNDGTRKKDGMNDDIPTYDNDDINQFARVFTGLGYDLNPLVDTSVHEPWFGMHIWYAEVQNPMIMWDEDDPGTTWRDEDQHENGVKYLLNGDSIPDGQSGLQDINDALDNLFYHPNVGPFLAYRLIQRLVKSNPTPAYVNRVANAFNNNGSGVRGDMQAVIKAILLDPEAREASYQQDDANSRLKEPLFRYTHFNRTVDKYNPYGYYWNVNYGFYEEVKQDILASPSVFNFFLPIDAPNGPIQDQDLVAPEYKLHDSRTSVGYFNNAYVWTQPWGQIMYTWTSLHNDEVYWVIDDLIPLAKDSETYINWLDQHLLGGNMSDRLRNILREALNTWQPRYSWHNYKENRVRMGMYLVLISPDYSIIR